LTRASSAPGVQAEAAELALVGADGGDGVGVGATGTVASTLSSSASRGRILPRKGRRMSADSADLSDLRPA
jgi:hypothetical protein